MQEVTDFIPEIMAGLILTGFAWAFRSWSITIKDSSTRIIDKLEALSKEFHEHRIKTENRVTKSEVELANLYKLLDRCRTDKNLGKSDK
jgi:hypothetical protein